MRREQQVGTGATARRRPPRQPAERAPVDLVQLAYHEAGHAVCGEAVGAGRAGRVSVTRRGAGGSTVVPVADSALTGADRRIDRLAVLLAGRAAEELAGGRLTAGAGHDLARAASLAWAMVTGTSAGRLAVAAAFHPAGTAGPGDRGGRVQVLLGAAWARAREVVTANAEVVEALARAVVRAGTLEGEPLDRLLGAVVPASPLWGDPAPADPPAGRHLTLVH